MLNGLDLFSGIAGLTIALSEWVRPIAYCENDPYAQACLLSKMFSGDIPIAPIWNDVRTLSSIERKEEIGSPVVDIIYGGFP
jgi:site-specific DNA-cytosine methylase